MAIKIKNLTKKYNNLTAVDNLNLEIHNGELFSLLGTNGAGKTTTIKMLSCLTRVTFGDAYVLGNSIVDNANEVKKIIGISPQETAIAPNLTVLENLQLMCGIYNFSKQKSLEKIQQLTNDFSLNKVLNKRSNTLSGGYKRRLSLAMALIGEPKILFLDEPTLGLDVISRSELWDTINSLKGKITIILTTHYMEEAEKLSNRVGIMDNGKLLKVGTVEEIVNSVNAKNLEEAFIKIVKEKRV